MNMKKILLILLSAVLVLTGALVPVTADGTPTEDTGAAVTSSVGYSQFAAEQARVELSSIPSIKGVSSVSESAYKIDSVEAYQNFVALVNGGANFDGKTVYLATDVDLSSVADQSPIGYRAGYEETDSVFTETSKAQFRGTFDGQGYEITGILIEKSLADTCYSALFGWVVNGTVKHLKVEGKVTHEKGTYAYEKTNFVGTGGLIANAEGKTTVTNVYCDVDVYGLRQTAGVIGRGGATVTNVTNAGDVFGGSCAGGIGGFVSVTTVLNSVNIGRITSSNQAAGILARARGTCSVNGCVNDGYIETTGSSVAGGIIGACENGGTTNVVSCTNYGLIVAAKGTTDPFGHISNKGILNVDETSSDRIRPGYSADLIVKKDQTGVADLEDASSVTATEYRITTPAGLKKLSELVLAGNNFKNVTVYLGADINMSGVSMEPIGFILSGESGTTKKPFCGTFDGQGHTISGLVMEQDTNVRSGIGLFGYTENAAVRNLVIESDCSFRLDYHDAYNGLAALVGYAGNNTTVTNVMTSATVIGRTHTAGIVARGTANVSYCTNYGYISGDNCAGGISAFRTGTVNNCVNYGAINSPSIAGGITARIYGNYTFENLVNYGTVYGGSYGGGVAGRTMSGPNTFKNCTNYGAITGNRTDGICRVNEGTAVVINTENCKNVSTVGYSTSLVSPVYNTGKSISKYEKYPNELVYSVMSGADLIKLSELVASGVSFSGVTVYLTENVNLKGLSMNAIGNTEHVFKGIFDGQGHSISHLIILDGALFGAADGAILRNVVLDGTCSMANEASNGVAAGLLAGSTHTTYVINASSAAQVFGNVAGGVVGNGEIVVMNATNKGSVYGRTIAGGVAAQNVPSVLSCINYGTVCAEKAGGIIGLSDVADARLISCFNHGLTMGRSYAGGIIGSVCQNCTLTNCASYAAVAPVDDAVFSATYNVEAGSECTVSGTCADLSNIGYSATLARDGSEELSSLIECGLAKNIEDYDPATEASVVRYVLIDSAEDMVLFSSMINNDGDGGDETTFCLTADVDMSGIDGFTPIGHQSAPINPASFFAGTFNGMGHTVSGLKYNGNGLFGILNGAQIRNLVLNVSGSSANADEASGALANEAVNAQIQNVFLTVEIESAATNTGALVGVARDTFISNCTVDGTVKGSGASLGGFVGKAEVEDDIAVCYYNCRNLVNLSATSPTASLTAGGFVGTDAGASIYSNCINLGTVTASNGAGALVGVKEGDTESRYVGIANYGKLISGCEPTNAYAGVDAKGKLLSMTNVSAGDDFDSYHLNQMFKVMYQIRDNGDGTFDLRLVSSTDSLHYATAGFRVMYYNQEANFFLNETYYVNEAYTSILNGNAQAEPSEAFADTSKYFFVKTIENIPNACLADFESSEGDQFVHAFTMGTNGSYIGYRPIVEISVPEKLTPTIEINTGIINRFDIPNVYEIGNTGVTVNLQYHAWPSVTVDENGVLYAFASARLEHVDPFGHTVMYKSYDGGKTWSDPYVINDTPMDDRDVGVTYMGNGKMLITYFRIDTRSLLTAEQSVTTSDGVVLQGNGTYTTWQKHKNIEQKHMDALMEYWSTLPASEHTSRSWCRISEDYGATWSEAITTPCSTPHGPILLDNGKLLYVGRGSVSGVGGDGIYAFLSSDGGYTWSFQAKIHENKDIAFCEPHVVELSNGRLYVAIRVQSDKTIIPDTYRVYTCFSDDGGKTWTTPKMVTDKNGKEVYGTPPQLLQLDNGAIVMTYASRNGLDRGEYAIVSYDGGMTWDEEIRLSAWKGGTSDIGYPATVHLGNGELVTVYYQAYEQDSYCSFLFTKWSLK